MGEEKFTGTSYKDGDTIVAEGMESKEMYIVQYGKVEVIKEGIDSDRVVAVLNEGNIFGEMGLIDTKPRSATVKAVGDARVLAIDRGKFLELVTTDPSFALRILSQLGEKIRDLNTMLSITTDNLAGVLGELAKVKESLPAQEVHLSKVITELHVAQVELANLRESFQAKTEG